MQKFYRFFFLFVLVFVASCDEINDGENGNGDGSPTIVSFAPSPGEVNLGESATLSWSVNGATSITIDNGIGDVTNDEDAQVTVTPTQTTTYTLSATNDQGQEDQEQTRITVSGTPTTPPPGEDATAPTGSFGVSDTQGGPFQNDESSNITSPDDERIVTVAPGGTFYAQVDYEDPSGIMGINISLVNSNPPGISGELNPSDPELGYFTKGDPTATCDLSSSAMNVTCVYPITVSEDAVNITALDNPANEFAYVFRTLVTDGAGNTSEELIRGYVIVDGEGDTPPTNPNPPTPPANQAPNADAGDDQEVEVGEEVTLNGSDSSDPDNDTLSYAWELTSQPDGSDASLNNASTASPTFTPSTAGDYVAQLTVTDGNGGSDTDSVTVTAQLGDEPPSNPDPPEENEDPDVSIEEVDDLTLEDGSASTNLAASVDDDEDDSFSYQWSVTSGEADNVEFASPTSEDTDVTFSAAGDYTLQLTVTDTDDSDSTGSATVAITVNEAPTDPPTNPNPPTNEAPTAAFTSQQQEGTLSVQFNASSSNDPDGTIASYSWDFGDGSSTTTQGAVFTKTYSEADEYEVSLTVTDNDGATSSAFTETVPVEGVDEPAQAPVIVDFTADPSSIAEGGSSTFSWELSGGAVNTLTFLDTSNGQSADVTNEESFTVENVTETRTFRLTATNEAGSVFEEVTLNVSGAIFIPGDDLVANDDTATLVLSEEPIPEVEIEVALNDVYPDGPNDNFPEIEVSSEPANGEAEVSDSFIIYTPEEGFIGTDTFEYTLILEDEELSSTATVTVTVQE